MSEEPRAHDDMDEFEVGVRKAKLVAHSHITKSDYWMVLSGTTSEEGENVLNYNCSYYGTWDMMAGMLEMAMERMPLIEAAILKRRFSRIMDEHGDDDNGQRDDSEQP